MRAVSAVPPRRAAFRPRAGTTGSRGSSGASTGSIEALVRVVAALVRVGCRGGKLNRGITFSGRRSIVGESVLRAVSGRCRPFRLFPLGVWHSGLALVLRVVEVLVRVVAAVVRVVAVLVRVVKVLVRVVAALVRVVKVLVRVVAAPGRLPRWKN